MSLEGPTKQQRPLTSTSSGPPREFDVTVISGPDAGLTRRSKERLILGKSAEASMVLKDEEVSRLHLELEGTSEGVRVKDRGSTNGTFLSGARIQQMTVFEEATLTIGATVLKVEVVTAASANKAQRSNFGKVLG